MHEHEFRSELWLPYRREVVFSFFSDALNLQTITPAFLNFVVLTPPPIIMQAGTQIDYKLRLRGFPIRWRSLISTWEPPHRFIDEQLHGPYRLWIHEHIFEEHEDGTLAKDYVRYAVPGGAFIERLFVRRDVEAIFAFRAKRLKELLGTRPAPHQQTNEKPSA
jgi:ligand-binding SRPBCC domain-containing protein